LFAIRHDAESESVDWMIACHSELMTFPGEIISRQVPSRRIGSNE
jgi:hypothetical protein